MAKASKGGRKAQPRRRRKALAPGKSPDAGLKQQLAEARAQKAAAAEILKLISRSRTDAGPVFDGITRSAAKLCRAPIAAVIRFDGAMLHVASIKVPPRAFRPFAKFWPMPIERAGIQGVVIRKRVLANVKDVMSDARIAKWALPLYRKLKVRSGLWVPMLREGYVIGLIIAFHHEAAWFGPESEELLKTFADQAVIAIENARLFNESREALERQTATAEILKVIASSASDVQPAFDAILECATRLCDAHLGVLNLFDGKHHRTVAQRGGNPRFARWVFERGPFKSSPGLLRLIKERRPHQFADIKEGAAFRSGNEIAIKYVEVGGARSLLMVPLLKEGRFLGNIAIYRPEVRQFTAKQVELVSMFASQAVIAIENVRLFNETREALERQTATAEILKVIASSPSDVQPVLEAVAKSGAKLCDAVDAVIHLREGDNLRYAAHYGDIAITRQIGDTRAISTTSLTSKAVVEGRQFHIHDVQAEARKYPEAAAMARQADYRTALVVPLMREGVALGTISIRRTEVRPFTQTQIDLLNTFADQAVIAIENVRLFNETKEALERQTATSDILQVISGSPTNTQPVFDAIVACAMRLCDTELGGLFLVAGETINYVHTPRAEDAETHLKANYPRRLDTTSLVGRSIVERRVIHVPDLGDSDAPSHIAGSGHIRSQLSVPLIREGAAIGSLVVARRRAGPFSPSQISLLQTFADQAVIAIENVRLFNETREALERQTATAEILKVIASSPSDVQPVFNTILRSAVILCGAEIAAVFPYDGKLVHLGATHNWSEAAQKYFSGIYPAPPSPELMSGRTILGKSIVKLTDAAADAHYDPKSVVTGEWRRMLGVPIMREGQVLGALVVCWREPGETPQRQVDLLQTFADQAVIAIENVRLFNETKEALERQTATAEILKVIASSPSEVQPVFDAIVQTAKRLIGAFSATVTHVGDGLLHLVAHTATTPEGAEALHRFFPIPVEGTPMGRSIQSRQPAFIDDFETDPNIKDADRELARTRGFRGVVFVPLMRGGVAIGSLNVTRREAGRMSEHHVDLLKTFADQAVIAIENVRLFNETKEALERQTATAEILRVIGGSMTDAQPVFDAIVKNGGSLFKDSRVTLWLISGDMLHTRASSGEAAEPMPIDRGSAIGACVLDGRLVHLPDLEKAADEYWRIRQLGLKFGYRSGIYAPLMREGRAIGGISVLRREAGAFDGKEVALLNTFADQAVIAIENVRLFTELEARNRDVTEALDQQRATADVLASISGSMTDTQPVFDAIVRNINRLFGTRIAVLQLLRDGLVEMPAVDGDSGFERIRENYPRPLDDATVGGLAMLSKQTVRYAPVIGNPSAPPATIQFARNFGFDSVLFTPMIHEGKVIGAIGTGRPEPKPFDERQVALIKTFADQAVIAIENVRLFNETKEALERQTATSEILKVIAGSPSDVQPVFDAIVGSALRLMESTTAHVTRLDDGTLHLLAFSTSDAGGEEALKDIYPVSIAGTFIADDLIAQRATIIVDAENDARLSERVRSVMKARGVRSSIRMPMISKNEAVGEIVVNRKLPGPFSAHQIELLRTFSDQAVIAIENVRLFNETKEALERQTATAEILKVISSSLTDTQPVFDAIVNSALRLFSGHGVGILLVDGNQLQLGSAGGIIDLQSARKRYPLPLDRDTVSGKSILDRTAVNIADSQAAEMPELTRNLARELGYHAIASAPMLREGVAIGAITVPRKTAVALSDKELALLKTFADQAVIAIENVRLFNETKEALERQTATAEILKVIASSPSDVQPVFDAIVRSGMKLFSGAGVGIGTVNGDEVVVQAADGLGATGRGIRMPLSRDSASGLAILERKVVNIPDTEAPDVPPHARENGRRLNIRSMTQAPMFREGEPIGSIGVMLKEPGGLDDKQITLLKTFADQAVIAIENVRLFRETQEALERQTATSEVLKVISSSPTDVQPVFDSIAERAAMLCGARFCSLSSFDGETIHMAAVYGATPEGAEAIRAAYPMKPGSATLAARVIRDRKPLHIADVQADPDYEGKDTAAAVGFRSVLGVPMMREGHLAGAIVIGREQAGFFPDSQVNLLTTFADQAVIAIENVRLFHEIEDKGRQLEVASQHKSNFLASMSHELRTPLNAILGFNEMIIGQVYGEVPADMQEPLNDIQTSGKHLLRLINNVLDLAKIEAGRMELSLQDYSVHDTVSSVHSTLRPLAADKGLEFLATVPNDVPLAYGDGGRIAQCLMNLAGNSLKFTKAGKVEISVETNGELLVYKVTDTGIGIPPDKIGTLFTEFKQTDATIASEYGGTGLGLSISRKFVEMHGGRIWVESELGKGSAFIIEVPIRVKSS